MRKIQAETLPESGDFEHVRRVMLKSAPNSSMRRVGLESCRGYRRSTLGPGFRRGDGGESGDGGAQGFSALGGERGRRPSRPLLPPTIPMISAATDDQDVAGSVVLEGGGQLRDQGLVAGTGDGHRPKI